MTPQEECDALNEVIHKERIKLIARTVYMSSKSYDDPYWMDLHETERDRWKMIVELVLYQNKSMTNESILDGLNFKGNHA